MRIAIDARELLGKPTGVGRYLSELISAWDDMPDACVHDYILCAPEAVATAATNLRMSSLDGRGTGTFWEQAVLPALVRRARADVLFAPAYSGPLLCPVPIVVTIHDVSFAAHPEWFSWREGLRRRIVTRLAAKRAAQVLTVSQFSKREIVRHLGVAAGKIDVVCNGASSVLAGRRHAADLSDTPTLSTDSAGSRVLFVGSIFNRRNVVPLIEGFARLARRMDVHLDVVGDNRTMPFVDLENVARATGVEGRIRIRSYVTDAELTALYAGATAFAWLSSYEGFGLTPLEALAAQIPIVVLDTPVAREIYDSAAVYVAEPRPDLIEKGLERVLFDRSERGRTLQAAQPVLARHSWQSCARSVLAALVAAGA